ncbi:MAG: sensor histidine kinase [Rubripirellula sp.]
MLKRRSIRTKLLVALTLLSAVVVLLASSGFWGLYRYRQLAKAVGHRAVEIPQASDLSRTALMLRESYDRTRQIREHGGMLDSSPLQDPLFDIGSIEQRRFEALLFEFGRELDTYQNQLLATSNEKSLLVDHTRQQRSLGLIDELFNEIRHKHDSPHIGVSYRTELKRIIDSLVDETEKHAKKIHADMLAFSEDVRGQSRAWIGMAWSCTILAILILGALLWSFLSYVVKPFRTLLGGSRLVAGGEFDHRIDLGTGDELSELAEAMNDMTDRFQGALHKLNLWCNDLDRQVRDRSREVIQNEQLASVGFLAAGVAHEINNPLASIAWSSESLQSRLAEFAMLSEDDRKVDDELYEALTTNLRRIEDEAYRCKGITEKLLDFSRLSEVRRASTDLSEVVSDVVSMVGKVGKFRCKTLRTHAEIPVVADVNPQEMRQVVLNLVTNALESVDGDGAVDVYVRNDEGCAAIVVEDTGCGMSKEVLDHLFEPFFTRRQDGTGTGLGLSITYRIVSQHGGSLNATSDGEGCGSRMEILLPLSMDDSDRTGSRISLGLNHESYQTTV